MTSSALLAGIPPGLILILGGLLLPVVHRWARQALVLGLPLVVLFLVWQVPDGPAATLPFLEYELIPVAGSAAGRLFATIFAIMAFTGGLFALRQARTVELTSAFVYAGSAIGVTFSGDLITLFVFWEAMALASTLVLWAAGTSASYRAGMRYVLVHLFGGVLLMVGIITQIAATGTAAFTTMSLDGFGTWLILAGFLVNAGAPPLSAWLPDAYPEASPSGAVFLSAFTSKTAVYVLLQGFPGEEILIVIGIYMVLYGIVYALIENDMRRILAYSIVDQVGFMLVGIGIGTEMALNGVAAHAFAHIIYKALLLMSAGSVLYSTGKRKCTDLGGLYRSMPITTICAIIGGVSISAFPLTSGFISKSMINQAAADEHLTIVWLLLTAGSAGALLHAGLRFPWFVFFQKDSGLRPPDPPLNMRLAMYLFAALCLGLGVAPGILYGLLPYPVDYAPYTTAHVLTQLQLLLFATAAFFLSLPWLKQTLTITLDVDWFYRRFGAALGREFTVKGIAARGRMQRVMERRIEAFIAGLYRHHGPQGILARTWPTGSTVLWVALLLAVVLISYYL